MAQAFRRTLTSLLKARKMTQTELAEKAGVDFSTVSRLLGGSRTNRFNSIEKIRKVLEVEPADLFDENRALARLGLRRLSDASASEAESNAHNNDLEIARGPQVWSPPEPALGEGAIVPQDPEMFRAMAELWNGLSTAHRASLLAEASRLKKARSVGTAAS
jgi:transcriptional regulator with XRE-family HTH domain